LDISALRKSIYFVKIQSKERIETKTLVIQ
jgi:hypothetical protein